MVSALPDQDSFYDVTDALEAYGIDRIAKRHMERQGADLDLLIQFQIFESSLMHEDGDDFSNIPQIENLRWEFSGLAVASAPVLKCESLCGVA